MTEAVEPQNFAMTLLGCIVDLFIGAAPSAGRAYGGPMAFLGTTACPNR